MEKLIDQKLGIRLRAARIAAGFKTSKEFTKAFDIPESTYSQHESGKRYPDDARMRFYADSFRVNYDWLQTGEGEPYGKHASMKKNESLADHLFEIIDPQKNHLGFQTHLINEVLLENIVDGVLLLSKDKKIATAKIAKIIAGVYSEIMSLEKDSEIQVKMVKSALKACEKLF